jgi:hypothetical protein
MLRFNAGTMTPQGPWMKSGYIHRVLAVFLLVYSLSDFCCLPSCYDEAASPPAAATALSAVNLGGDQTSLSGSENSRHEDESQPCQDECCFCCAHVVPSSPVTVAAIIIDSPGGEQPSAFLPKSPPRTLFHPPRSA